MDRTLVFVYGTLKRDFPNHGLIEDLIRSGDASFVAAGRTASSLPLVVGPWGIPFLLPIPGSGRRVSGELFAVSARGLARIDDLEGTRRGHYERLPIAVVPNSGGGRDEEEAAAEAAEAEAYYAHRSYAAEMRRRSGEKGLRVYSEEDALGYCRPKDRPRGTTFLGQIQIFLASTNQ
ncbi:putative gamma-glutamylcyclotransferase At3g02910 [Phoenix dactylifera]|uniref:Gamma-glutamylcyclotransferase family protein n=1 Tax=Phoenix dactylifera TaxID=42345 RepID=A0A8B7BZQ9_PHODC|nr:putative gamma-glutamylcyclotransferase At3g02910 [Phoenix dactylifera]